MKNEVFIVLSTFPDVLKARQIGTLLVERQLAACVNLIPAVESIYRWQEKVESSSEVLGVFKTSREVLPALMAGLAELHPYEVPEILASPAQGVVEPYAAWVINNVALPDQ